MIGIVAIVSPKPEKVDEVRKGLCDMADYVKANEPGCSRYKVVEQFNIDGGAPDFVVIEEYDDQAALDAHFASDAFKALGKRAEEESLLAKPFQVKITKVVGGFDSK